MNSTPDKTIEFLSLYNREQRPIYVYIRSLLFRQDDAEEVFQETCIELWNHFDQFEMGTNFQAWAKQIARHRTLAFCKRRHVRENLVFSTDILEVMADAAEEEPLESEERRNALVQCLKKLKEEDVALVERRYGERITTVRLAEELGRPLNTVYKALQRIRRGLKICIERSRERNRALGGEV